MTDWKDVLMLTPRLGFPDVQNVWYHNGKFIGEVIKDVDGYWKFGFPIAENVSGLWQGHDFMLLADMLIELNMDWDTEIKEFFSGQGN